MWLNLQFPADMVTFPEEIVNGKLHFLCGDVSEAVEKIPNKNKTDNHKRSSCVIVCIATAY